jgi:hypothetical protein
VLFISERATPYRLRRYHFRKSDPLRIRLRRKVHPSRSSLGRWIEAVAFLAGVGMVILYMYGTYQNTWNVPQLVFTVVFNAIFVARFLLRAVIAEPGRRGAWLLSFEQMCDVASVVNAILPFTGFINTFYTFAFLRAVNAYYSYSYIDLWLDPSFALSKLQRYLLRMALLFVAFLCVMGFTTAILEVSGDPDSFGVAVANDWAAISSVYWAVITVSKAGGSVI